MNPNMVFMAESRTLTRPTADVTKHAQFRKKKLKRGRFGWGEQACPPWDSLDIPLSRTEGKAGWHVMRLRALHPKISMGHQLMCEEEAAASVEFPPERKKSSHADRSGKVGGEGGLKAEQTLGGKWDTSFISVWPSGSVSLSLAQASSSHLQKSSVVAKGTGSDGARAACLGERNYPHCLRAGWFCFFQRV